jgi:dTDP-glucose 4,6-dehydratase
LYITDLILKTIGKPEHLKKFVTDRPGHDRRYAVATQKIRELGWIPRHNFEEAMFATITWYVNHREWWQKIKSGEYLDYYRRHYQLAE